MSVYPQELVQAATNQRTNREFIMLINQRVQELTQDVVNSTDQQQILEAHTELTNVRQFAEWIEHVSEQTDKGVFD